MIIKRGSGIRPALREFVSIFFYPPVRVRYILAHMHRESIGFAFLILYLIGLIMGLIPGALIVAHLPYTIPGGVLMTVLCVLRQAQRRKSRSGIGHHRNFFIAVFQAGPQFLVDGVTHVLVIALIIRLLGVYFAWGVLAYGLIPHIQQLPVLLATRKRPRR